MTRYIVRFLTASSVAALLLVSSASAEDTKGKWQFGFGLSYFSTVDDIRSNSDLAFVATNNADGGIDAVGTVDERHDINILNQASIADDFKIDLSGSYGLTRWLSLEIAASYQKSAVGNIEYLSQDNSRQPLPTPKNSNFPGCGKDVFSLHDCGDFGTLLDQPEKETSTFVPVGQITKIPIQLSGLVRFRPESPFDPYVGLGIGYTYSSLDNASEFNARAREVSQLDVSTAWEGEFTNVNGLDKKTAPAGSLTFSPGPLQATVRNSFEWHAIGGVDYYINDRFSFYVDARYFWTSGQIDITTDGAHQVLFAMSDNGQLLLQKQMTDPSDSSKPYLWEDKLGLWNPNPASWFINGGGAREGLECTITFVEDGRTQNCTGDGLFETEDKDRTGFLDPAEDDGILHVYAPGPIPYSGTHGITNDRIMNITASCPKCVGNEAGPIGGVVVRPDTEDRNYNFYMDRFLLYGIDFCTTAESVGSAACARSAVQYRPGMVTQYVWPEGCEQTAKTNFGNGLNPEGCPAPQPPDASQAVLTGTGADGAADTVLIQGGNIRLGGFSLGLGFKFTF